MRVLQALVVVTAVYLAVVIIAGPAELLASVFSLSYLSLIIAVTASIASIGIEFIRWDYYIKCMGIKTRHRARIFLAGNVLAILPFKSGEMLRSVLLKREGVAYRKSIPVFFVSNMVLFLAVLTYALPMLHLLDQLWLAGAGFLVIIIFMASLHFTNFLTGAISLCHRTTGLGFLKNISISLKLSKKLTRPRVLIYSYIIALLHEGLNGVAFLALFSNFEAGVPGFVAFSFFNASLILGLFSMVPGGFGVIEGSGMLMLGTYMHISDAAAMVLLMRILTIWLSVFGGIAALLILRDKGLLTSSGRKVY